VGFTLIRKAPVEKLQIQKNFQEKQKGKIVKGRESLAFLGEVCIKSLNIILYRKIGSI